jgi:hypothetical protein
VGDPQVANIPRAFSEATLWALVCGPSFMHWCWNPKLERPDVLRCRRSTSTRTRTPPTSARRYVIHSRFIDPEQVYDMWGTDVKQHDAVEQADVHEDDAAARRWAAAPVLNGVTVNELWHLPSRRYPNGRYVAWAGKRAARGPEPLPLRARRQTAPALHDARRRPAPRHPLVRQQRQVPAPRQMELNQYHAQRIQIRKNFANPKWLIDEQRT